MPSYAVFFADEAAIGMERVAAANAAAAEAVMRDHHPDAQVHAFDGAPVTEENLLRLLRHWLKGVLAVARCRPPRAQCWAASDPLLILRRATDAVYVMPWAWLSKVCL